MHVLSKKLYLLLACVSSCILSHAQILVNKTDKFTGNKIKSATVQFGKASLGTWSSGMAMTFTISRDKKLASFTWMAPNGTNGAFNEVKPADLSLLLKMDNDSIMQLKGDTSMSKASNIMSTSILVIITYVTDEQLQFLSAHKIKFFRVGLRGNEGIDLNEVLFTERNRKEVQKAAAYLLESK